jgi:hypothetical protein
MVTGVSYVLGQTMFEQDKSPPTLLMLGIPAFPFGIVARIYGFSVLPLPVCPGALDGPHWCLY